MTNELITLEEICKILHISKRKCAWMLQNQVIPCKDTGKESHRYKIFREEFMVFKKSWDAHPEEYDFPVTFGAKVMKKADPYYIKADIVPTDFRDWLDDEWYLLDDILSPKEIWELLGYSHNTVRRWLNNKWLESVVAHGQEIISREWLIEFMYNRAFQITKKSKIHIELLKKYFDTKEEAKQKVKNK